MPRQSTASLVDAAVAAAVPSIVAAVVAALTPAQAERTTAQAQAPVHVGPSGKADGRKPEYTCAECGRMFRSSGDSPNASPTGGLTGHGRTSGHKVR